jgi:hypothetical protein
MYALCYFHNDTAPPYDSGLRFTFSKIYNLKYHTGDSPDRDNTPIFLSTNRLAQNMIQQLQYQGSSDLDAKYISIVKDSHVTGTTASGIDGTGNPCVQMGGASFSSTSSGPVQLKKKRVCTTHDATRRPVSTMGRATIAPYFVELGSVVHNWEECKAACQVDHGCAQVVYNKVDRKCYPSSVQSTTENPLDYDNSPYGQGKWISADCNETATAYSDTAFIPQYNCTGANCDPSYYSFGGWEGDICAVLLRVRF